MLTAVSSFVPRFRLHHLWIALAIVAAFAYQWILREWQVDDSAISATFARNLAAGDGLVAYPGGERVEGYSNPLWVFILAGAEWCGASALKSAGTLSLVFVVLTLIMVWKTALELAPRVLLSELRSPLLGMGAGAVAVLSIGLNAQFGIWTSSGLECALFNFLLAGAIYRTLLEGKDGGTPWAALWFFGLAITRPEGIAYAAIGGFFSLLTDFTTPNRRWMRRTALWLAMFFIPFGGYHAVRYAYFAFPFPATYYAKAWKMDFSLHDWDARGWRQLREWALKFGHVGLAPIYFVGLVGTRGWRALTTVGIVVAAVCVFALPSPEWARVWMLCILIACPLFLAIGRPTWKTTTLIWSLALFGIGFSIKSGGDWMRGYRWMNNLTVPLGLMLSIGFLECLQWFKRRLPFLVVMAVGLLGFGAAGYKYTLEMDPSASPEDVKRRVDFHVRTMETLHVERVLMLDHDMGGFMWWGAPLGRTIDAMGLVDIPFALHKATDHRRAFVTEYLWSENTFDFAHLHASTMYAMRGQKQFKKEYIEIPGYPPKTKKHRANFIRRSLLMKKKWEGSAARAVRYPDGIAITGIDTPIVELAGPGKLYVEIGMASRQGKDFSVELFITGPKGAHASWPLLPGYDGWLPVSKWKKGEVFHGKYSVRLPKDLPEGPYSFGILVRDAEEQILFPEQTPGGVSGSESYVLGEGEVNFGSTFMVVPRDDAKDLAHKTRKMAIKAAANGQCEKGEQLWNLARLRRIENYKWAKKYRPSVGQSIAICWAEKASETESLQTQLEYIRRGREWNHKSTAIQELGEKLGDSWFAQGLEAQQAEDWETAFQAFLQAVAADPRNSWARRYAEEARAHRLSEE